MTVRAGEMPAVRNRARQAEAGTETKDQLVAFTHRRLAELGLTASPSKINRIVRHYRRDRDAGIAGPYAEHLERVVFCGTRHLRPGWRFSDA